MKQTVRNICRGVAVALACLIVLNAATITSTPPPRLLILKVDGLGADLLEQTMNEIDPQSGKSKLPWITHIFRENGTVFRSFYTRGISLSAPSWSMLDTGRPSIIRGNVEFDRYTGSVYDYLNFFPFYLENARTHQEDMPGVQVLDRAGIPLSIDQFQYPQILQSFQLYQRGVRWTTLQRILGKHLVSKSLTSLLETGGGPSASELLADQTLRDLVAATGTPAILYLDDYTGEIDHEGHATNQPASLADGLERLDALAGRIWNALNATKAASPFIFVLVSDHGMNNVPGVFSQAFSLPDLFNSPEGGAHHVVTNRYQLSDYRLLGLNPLVRRVVTPSTASSYLAGESSHYPTAWLDLDGNERASLHLRNDQLNKIQMLLQQLAKPTLTPELRHAETRAVLAIVKRQRPQWQAECDALSEELSALQRDIEQRETTVTARPKKWSKQDLALGRRIAARRFDNQLQAMQRELAEYRDYVDHLQALIRLNIEPDHVFKQRISDLVPEFALGDNNTVRQLEHYAVGPGPQGVVLDANGNLDDERSFHYLNYFSLLTTRRVRNNPQAALSANPIDFVALRLPEGSVAGARHTYWLTASEEKQLLVLVNAAGEFSLRTIRALHQDPLGQISFQAQTWQPDLPLHLFEDEKLHLAPGVDRAAWLSGWHSESEWLRAIHECRYSNGVIGIAEQLSPVADNVPGRPDVSPTLLRYERRRRDLVQPDLQIFAEDHWNFNARNVNPGGNHGGFFRISTHSVWMMAGEGVPVRTVNDPYDSLNFASTVLQLSGKRPPLPDKVVALSP